jgi:hypothetical protein
MARKSVKKAVSGLISDEDRDIIQECKDFISACEDASESQRELSKSDFHFMVHGNQWDPQIRADRDSEGRPCLEVDRLTPFVNQLVNEQRQNRPQPNVNPVSDGADKGTAEILQGMIRHIAYLSDGDAAIDTAYEQMIIGGFGYIRVLTEYIEDSVSEQEIKIGRIVDPFSVFFDPASEDPAGADANAAAIVTWLTRDAYKEQYPDSKLSDADLSLWSSLDEAAPGWATRDGNGVRVVEYYKRIKVKTKLKAEDGTTRDAYTHKVKWYKLNAIEVLEQTDWAGKYIPIIPLNGKEMFTDGKRYLTGIVRTAKDPARFYNFWKSSQAEMIALAPKAPFIVPKGAIVDPGIWKNANRKPVAYLEYNSKVDGQPVNAPQPAMFEPNIQAISAAMMGAEQDIKAVTGMYDPVQGISNQGQSGVAIRQLQRQGQSVNYHFADNQARSIKHLGRILIDLIPKIYDTPRVIRIVKPDDTEDLVQLNQQFQDESGVAKIYDPSVGRYDVTVSVGPSYQTKRQESQAILDSLMQNPVMGGLIAQKAPDLVASLLDFHMAKELQERLTPPEYAKKDGIPPQVQQQLQQMQQQMQAMQQALQQSGQQLQQMQMEAQSKEAELSLKAQEMQYKAQSEAGKAALDQGKLQIDGEKLQLEARKLDIEAARLKLDAMRGMARPIPQVGVQAEPGSPPMEEMGPDAVEIDIEVPADMQMPMAKRPISTEEVASLLAQQSEIQSQQAREMFGAMLEGLDAIINAPRPEPRPVQVVLRKNSDGSVTGSAL